MTREEELAWAAGFFDGEGSTYVQTRKPSTHHRSPNGYKAVKVRLSQVRREPLDRFAAIVGVGVVRGPYVMKNPRAQPQFEWAVSGKAAQGVVDLLWEWLSAPKQEQATLTRRRVAEAVAETV